MFKTLSSSLLCAGIAVLALPSITFAEGDLVEVKQDFSKDPGWEGLYNRIEASDPPTIKQDFGWSPGKIGGTIWKSTTPAWYAMPLDPPLSFKDKFSASGKIAVMSDGKSGLKDAAYLGFFNHERQGWRAWSSLAIRVVHQGERAAFYIDGMTAKWGGIAAEMECNIPADGSEHTWKLSYDPDATRSQWTDTRLQSYLTTGRQEVVQILAKANKVEPDLTREALIKRLKAALELGLVSYLPRHGTEFWQLKQSKDEVKGAVTLEVAGNPPFTTYLTAEKRNTPTVLDRFGIFNTQLFYGVAKFYTTDLEVNGTKIDLHKDPAWEGHGNRVEYVQHDFQRLNFGYSPDTRFAGGQKGEIGGVFYGHPHHGYYADDVGRLTLDDPIHFSGKITLYDGSTDSGSFFGYFNAADKKALLEKTLQNKMERHGWPQVNTMGIFSDSAHYYFTAWLTPSKLELSKRLDGPVLLPDRKSRTVDFAYDPKANNGLGRITVTLEGEKPFHLDLTAEQRKAGATFDHFGLMSSKGAKYETLYLDDLTYTARRAKDFQPTFHKQEIIKIPFPMFNGRQYD